MIVPVEANDQIIPMQYLSNILTENNWNLSDLYLYIGYKKYFTKKIVIQAKHWY